MALLNTIQHLFLELARDAASQYTPFPVNTLLKFMLEMGARQTSTLERIEAKLDRVAVAPFKEGLAFLEQAQSAPDESKWKKDVSKARDKFVEAGTLEDYIDVKTLAVLYLGICYKLLSDTRAPQTLERAHDLATDQFIQRLERYKKYRGGVRRTDTNDKIAWDIVFSHEKCPMLKLPCRIEEMQKLVRNKENELQQQKAKEKQKSSEQPPKQLDQPWRPSSGQRDQDPLRSLLQTTRRPPSLTLPPRQTSFPVKQPTMDDLFKNRKPVQNTPPGYFVGLSDVRRNPLQMGWASEGESLVVRSIRSELRSLQADLESLQAQQNDWWETLQDIRAHLRPEDQNLFDTALCTTALLARVKHA